MKFGAAGETRTRNLRVKGPLLFRLNYDGMEREAGIEPAFPAWQTSTLPLELFPHGQGGGIRTPNFLLPKQERYQVALRPNWGSQRDLNPSLGGHNSACGRYTLTPFKASDPNL